MNLNHRITRLEHTLGRDRCSCANNAELAWPGHQPDPTCPTCGGETLIYQFPHHPRQAEPQLRTVLPLLAKTYNGNDRADLIKLTDHELHQLRTALQTYEDAASTQTNEHDPRARL